MNLHTVVISKSRGRFATRVLAIGLLAGYLAAAGAHVRAQTAQLQAGSPARAAPTGSGAQAHQQPSPQSAPARSAPAPVVSSRTSTRSQATRTLALAGSALALMALAALMLPGRLRWLIVGEDNRYSTSKFQMLLWSWCVLTVYVAAIGLRWVDAGVGANDGITIPASLLALAGMSTLTFAGAKYITVSRIERSGDAGTKAAPLSGPRFLRDLVNDDSGHRPDIGDTQMLLITVVAVAIYVASANHWLGLLPPTGPAEMPEVDGTLLGALGIGQAAYLAKKHAGDTSPSATGPVLQAPIARPVRPAR